MDLHKKRMYAARMLLFMFVFLIVAASPVRAESETVGTQKTIDLTPIIQAFIGLLAAIITTRIMPWLKSKTTAQQQENMRMAVRTLVYAAEQIYGAGRGNEKLNYVKNELLMRGFEVDIQAIEASVKEMGMSGMILTANEVTLTGVDGDT